MSGKLNLMVTNQFLHTHEMVTAVLPPLLEPTSPSTESVQPPVILADDPQYNSWIVNDRPRQTEAHDLIEEFNEMASPGATRLDLTVSRDIS